MVLAMPLMAKLITSPELSLLQWQHGSHYLPATKFGS